MDNTGSLFEGRYKALLFDMDGTVLNSIAAAEHVWGAWAIDHGLDIVSFLPTIHGVRSVDRIAALELPGINPEIEAQAITEAEIASVDGIVEIAGAAKFLRSLPANRWAIVTSAPLALAKARLKAAGLPLPKVLVTSEDVTTGKPDPEGYELAAKKLGVNAKECLIFEDSAVGILAAQAAGAQVLVIAEAHIHRIEIAGTTIPAYEDLIAHLDDEGFIHVCA
ncbi:MAG: HAD-IA family hydrolase [Betaproteobacteria bacterium]|nr:HAD-IA family hydrolase [Betaproteobacteria bacterium]